jgi:sulfite exporter TauE/SafE
MGDELTLLTALMAGVLGSTHCLGMCGGIAAALGVSARAASESTAGAVALTTTFNIGRLAGYTIIGALAGLLGGGLGAAVDLPAWAAVARGITGALMIMIGLQIAFRWQLLRFIEESGGRFWARLAPAARRLLPVRSPARALALGMLWGWLPCGLVYSMVLMALVAGDATSSALIMAAFGLGTLPAMTLTGLAATRFRLTTGRPLVRRLAGALLIAFGVWTALVPLRHAGGSEGDHHQHHAANRPSSSVLL